MIKKNLFNFFIFFYLYSFNVNSSNIAVINLEFIFNETSSYNFFIEEVENFKNRVEINLKLIEQELIDQNNEIESSSLILNNKEIDVIIKIYQSNLSNFQKDVEKYNEVINSNIDLQKNFILNEIAKICKKIALDKNYDLILTQNDYFLSSEKIDISNLIISNLNQLDLVLNFNENIND